MKFAKTFFILVTVCSIVLLFMYVPVFLGVGNTVKVVNLNVYSERLRDTFGKLPSVVERLTDGGEKGALFHGHNNDSSIKSVNEVKDKTKSKDFDEQPVKKDAKATPSKTPETKVSDSKSGENQPKCSDRGSNLGEFVLFICTLFYA